MSPIHRIFAIAMVLFGVSLALFLILALDVRHVAAQPICKELQIVFLTDQSGSMGGLEAGSTVHPNPNDPLKLRFFAPKHAVEMLGPLRYGSHPDSSMRVALVHFGDRPEIGLNWTVITPTNEIEWKQQLHGIAQTLKADQDRWTKSNLGGTNFVRAFQAAASLFNQLPPQVGDCPYRAIVLLTDGKPEQPDPGFTVPKHFAELQDYLSKYLPRPNYEIYVIGMSEDTYWTETEPSWLKVAGDAKNVGQVKTQDEVGRRFKDILIPLADRLPGTRVIKESICPGEVFIPPYLQWVAFILYKSSEQPDHLQVEDGKGIVAPTRTDVTVTVEGFDSPIETVRVTKPLPGRWYLRTTLPRARCDIDKLSITAAGKLVKPSPTDEVPVQYTRLNLSFQIADAAGSPLPDYGSAYALDVEARVIDKSAIEDLSVTPAGAGNVFSAPYIPIEDGIHSVEVVATTQDPLGNPITVISQTIATFQVAPLRLTMLEGPTGGTLPQRVPISITLAMVGPSKKPVRVGLPANVTLDVTVRDQTKPITLTTAPDGSFTTTFIPQQVGSHRLAYQGIVILPDGTQKVIGKDQIAFNVSQSILLRPQVISPAQTSFEAADWLGRTTGMVFEVQLVDESGQPIAPGQVVDGDPMKVFQVHVLDSRRQDRSSELVLGMTGQPGLFRAEGKTLEPNEYTVQVLPAAKLKPPYVWEKTSWTSTFKGERHIGFFALLALVGLVALDVGICGSRWLLSRSHPFRGTLVIAELARGVEEETREVWKQPLPQSNYVYYANGWVWHCLIPWRKQDFPTKLNIRSLEVRSKNAQDARNGIVQVAVETPKKGKRQFSLHRGGLENAKELGYGFLIYLR